MKSQHCWICLLGYIGLSFATIDKNEPFLISYSICTQVTYEACIAKAMKQKNIMFHLTKTSLSGTKLL